MAISRYDESVRRIIMSGDIREGTTGQFLEQMTAFERADANAPITIYIDTHGGSLRAGLAIYDIIRMCACPIETIGISKVMSAGALILAAGDKGSRYLTPHTGVMIHQISNGVHGTVQEMEIVMEETRRQQAMYVKILSKHTGKSQNRISKDMMVDFHMSATEAIEYGLADKITPHRRAKRSSKKAK